MNFFEMRSLTLRAGTVLSSSHRPSDWYEPTPASESSCSHSTLLFCKTRYLSPCNQSDLIFFACLLVANQTILSPPLRQHGCGGRACPGPPSAAAACSVRWRQRRRRKWPKYIVQWQSSAIRCPPTAPFLLFEMLLCVWSDHFCIADCSLLSHCCFNGQSA